jgi:hypothetical protein
MQMAESLGVSVGANDCVWQGACPSKIKSDGGDTLLMFRRSYDEVELQTARAGGTFALQTFG